MLYKEVKACRSCGSTKLDTVLDLGNLCISDFIKPGEQEDLAPLELMVCDDCSLVQLRHTVDRDRLYRSYYYRSGTNESMMAALRDVVDDACRRVTLEKGDAVLDIGANDGTMLRMYPPYLHRDGFEPSNLANEATKDGCFVWHDYFPPRKVVTLSARPYKVITSIACFYDVDDPNYFVDSIRRWLHKDGVWVVQFQDLHSMLACNGFDNICHEHLTYWSTYAFYNLCARHDLRVVDVSHNKVNGGSVRYVVKHGKWTPPKPTPYQAAEFAHQLKTFALNIEGLREKTLNLLWQLKTEDKRVIGVAASTKANTLLQFYDVARDLLPAIADRNPDKWGKVTVGQHIPIMSEDEMRALEPDYLLALAWHFIEPFKERYADLNAKWITPLPQLEVIGGGTCRSIPDELCVSA